MNGNLQHALTIGLLAALLAMIPANAISAEPDAKPAYTTQSLRGRVVFMAEALERLHGVKSVADAKENTLALETPQGKLYPLVEDKRGHSFRLDKRLMNTPVELLVRRHKGSPAIQVIRIYTLEEGQRWLVDYWCDICSISMFELKPCDCCQGPTRLRKRKVDADGEPLSEEREAGE